jgi:outer membrane protein with beta-barrel domain
MLKRGIVTALLFLLAGVVPAFAQGRVEVSGFVGYSLADGVESDPRIAGDGNIYDTVEPADSAVYGFTVGFLVGEGAEVGFRWAQQPTTLNISGTTERELGDLSINSYHGYFAYNFGETDAKMRPFVLIGFGATNYGSVDVTVAGVDRSLPGETQFSTTWAAGVKYFPNPKVGVRASFEWTPTYIKTDSAGWWCDPYWGCYLVGNAQYSNSIQFNGGVTFRF